MRFVDGAWSSTAPVEVFDTSFITDNIYAGELVELAHDRGLFSLIIGDEGVRLANHLDRFNPLVKRTSTALKDAQNALAADLPSDMSRTEFFALAPSVDYATRLERAELALKAVKQADKVAALKPLSGLRKPEIKSDLSAVLASTISDIDVKARDRLLSHYQRFHLDKNGEAWINYGLDHIHEDACPMCGRTGVDEAGMVTLYGQIFSRTYKSHLGVIREAAREFDVVVGDEARSELAKTVAMNAEAVTKWSQFVALDTSLPDTSGAISLLADVHVRAKSLLDRKRASPLEEIDDHENFSAIAVSLPQALSSIEDYNAAVEALNACIAKAAVDLPGTEEGAQRALDNVRKRSRRHDPGVQGRVEAFLRAEKRDDRAKRVRSEVQKELKEANVRAAGHYHARVNHYLERFGANFEISRITNSMQGNAGQSDYGLVIKGELIARGRGRPAEGVPNFRNTLSAGDKTTLALAFFLAKLDQDEHLDSKIIVIDDPLSSHDSHRRGKTIEAIKNLCGRCMQMIVLSHDEFFLREVERRCEGVPSSAFQIEFEQGEQWSNAKDVNLDQLCRARHVKMIDELKAFVDERTGDADDIVLKVRQVLETHYRRSYSAYFTRSLNLGRIVRCIADEGSSHPCHADLARLEACNTSTCDSYHGDDAVIVPKRGVDPDELRVICMDALELIGARRPAPAAAASTSPIMLVSSHK